MFQDSQISNCLECLLLPAETFKYLDVTDSDTTPSIPSTEVAQVQSTTQVVLQRNKVIKGSNTLSSIFTFFLVWRWCKLNIYPPSAQYLLTRIMNFPNFPTTCPTKDIFHKLSRPGKRPLSFPKFMTTVRTLLKLDVSVQIEPFSFHWLEDRGKRKYNSFCTVDCGEKKWHFLRSFLSVPVPRRR